MPASDALVMHAEFAQDLQTVGYEAFMEVMVEEMREPTVGGPMLPRAFSVERVMGDLRMWTRAARTYYVSPEMTALAVGAMEQLPDDAVVRKESPMSPQGFLWLPSPLRVWDIRGRVLSVNAMLWSVFGEGVMVWLLADKYDEVNVAWAHGMDVATLPRLTPWGAAHIVFGEPLPMTVSLRGQKPIPPSVEVRVEQSEDSIAWFIGNDGMTPEEMVPVRARSQEALFITVLWRLMRQTIVALRPEEPDKRSRRLAEKHLRGDRHVTVIELRSREYHGRGERMWVLDHRILVDGYYRKQWYGSGNERWWDYIYIHPHLRGPEGAPLVVTQKVRALVR